MASPERLNLDRRGLQACPLLQGEERLRLLNYQNNAIRVISNLHTLPYLIFLDLYNNQIGAISGLEQVPSLRVLMLGKNLIEKIERLDCLAKLDVLDLHCNQLQSIEGLSHLAELRVLNLAGNRIVRVDTPGLSGLTSLAELNLRRNAISSIAGVEALPSLQRLFLSYNVIGDVQSVGCLASMGTLLELALDGNPLALEPSYRASILELTRSIRHLDLRRVSEDERRAAQAHAKREGERQAERQRKQRAEEDKSQAMRAIEHAWEQRTSREGADNGADAVGGAPAAGSAALPAGSGSSARGTGDSLINGEDGAAAPDVAPSIGACIATPPSQPQPLQSPRGSTSAHGSRTGCAARWSSSSRAEVDDAAAPAANGSYCYEGPGGGSCGGSASSSEFRGHVEVTDVAASGVWLSVYGDAAENFDRTTSRVENAVGVSFSYYPFERIAKRSLPKLRKLRRLREVHFERTEIHSLYQLHSLGMLSGLTALRISADVNPVVAHPHFISLTVSLLPHLRSLNGVEVTAEQREEADRQWRRLKRLYLLAAGRMHATLAPLPYQHAMHYSDTPPSSPVKFNACAASAAAAAASSKQEASKAATAEGKDAEGPAASEVANAFVNRVVEHAIAVDEKISQLNAAWPKIVAMYQGRVRAEVKDRALFLRRYEAAARGQTEQTTLAMVDRFEASSGTNSSRALSGRGP